MVRLAVASLAHVHAAGYVEGIKELESKRKATFYGLFDDNKTRLKRAVKTFKPRKVFDNFQELVDDPEVDGVVVSSEHAKLAKFSVPLLRAGKHVLVEKPMATDLEEALEEVQTAKHKGVKLAVGFVMRFHQATAKLRDSAQKLSPIKVIISTNHGTYPGGWFGEPGLAGGGAIMDHTVHLADLIRWFTHSEFEEVYASSGKNIRPHLKVEDNAVILAKMTNDIRVSIDCSWSRLEGWPTWGGVDLTVIGAKGCVKIEAFNDYVWKVVNQSLRWHYCGPNAVIPLLADFVESIEHEDRQPLANGADGAKALAVALAAYSSIKSGEKVRVKQPLF
jgi:UDP-N-acetylglucosamine 3-dehydrogenase